MAVFSLLALVLLGGCQLLRVGRVPRTLPRPQAAQIEISNQTTLDVTLAVNGQIIGEYPPKTGETIEAGRLPPLPWTVEARSSSGRVLTSMTVQRQDLRPTRVGRGGVSWTIPAGRADLSCGRLQIYAGDHPPAGPPPGPGTPGDCQP